MIISAIVLIGPTPLCRILPLSIPTVSAAVQTMTAKLTTTLYFSFHVGSCYCFSEFHSNTCDDRSFCQRLFYFHFHRHSTALTLHVWRRSEYDDKKHSTAVGAPFLLVRFKRMPHPIRQSNIGGSSRNQPPRLTYQREFNGARDHLISLSSSFSRTSTLFCAFCF